MSETLRGLWLEVRIIPVLLWSFSAITLGTALAARGHDLQVWYYLGAVALGVLIQGLLAHSVNEVEDWRSGTDRHASPRVISGGSKVIVAGLLPPRALWWVFGAAFAATTVIGLALVAARGLVVLPFGLVGVAGAILYTLPPVRAAYRPFAGEAIAFICLVDCVCGAHVLQGPSIDGTTVAAAVAVAAYAVSMLMVHHYLDRDADAAADPPKVTSIVRLGLVTAAATRSAGAWSRWPRRWRGRPPSRGSCRSSSGTRSAWLAHLRCRPAEVESVTMCETVIIFAGIASALCAAALLEPPLVLTLLAAAVADRLRDADGGQPRPHAGCMTLEEELETAVAAAARHARPGEQAVGVMAADPAGSRVYVVALAAGDELGYVAVDSAGAPVADRRAREGRGLAGGAGRAGRGGVGSDGGRRPGRAVPARRPERCARAGTKRRRPPPRRGRRCRRAPRRRRRRAARGDAASTSTGSPRWPAIWRRRWRRSSRTPSGCRSGRTETHLAAGARRHGRRSRSRRARRRARPTSPAR